MMIIVIIVMVIDCGHVTSSGDESNGHDDHCHGGAWNNVDV